MLTDLYGLVQSERVSHYLATSVYPFLDIHQYEQLALAKTFHCDVFHHLIAVWLVLFSLAYLLLLLFFNNTAVHTKLLRLANPTFEKIEELANRSVSNVNSFFAVYTFLVWFLQDLPNWNYLYDTPDKLGFNSSFKRDFSIGTVVAYLWFDLARTLFFNYQRKSLAKSDGISMILHHMVCSFGFYFGVRYQFGVLYLAFMVQNEVSTPLLNFRYFLAEMNWKSSLLYTLNEFSFCLIFFLDRIILNAFLFASIDINIWHWDFAKHNVPLVMGYLLFVMGHCHMLIQIYWMGKIFRMLYRKLTGSKRQNHVSNTGSADEFPILTQNEKSSKLLGLPNGCVNSKAAKRLGVPLLANEKAARTLGIEAGPSGEGLDQTTLLSHPALHSSGIPGIDRSRRNSNKKKFIQEMEGEGSDAST